MKVLRTIWIGLVGCITCVGQSTPVDYGLKHTLNKNWSQAGDITVGSVSPDNSLLISSGWVADSTGGCVGFLSAASNNTVRIDGLGSRWVMSKLFSLGIYGDRNRLNITAGGRMVAGKAVMGGDVGYTSSAPSGHNDWLVQGAGSLCVLGRLTVGGTGRYNELHISDGGAIAVKEDALIGRMAVATGNEVSVSGSSSQWLSDSLCVGVFASTNRFLLERGASAQTQIVQVGGEHSAMNNRLEIRGIETVWSNAASVVIGTVDNEGNGLLLADQGRLITESYKMHESSELALELMPLGAANLVVSGTAELNGTLSLSLAGGYEPKPGDVFELFDWPAMLQGTFSAVAVPDLPEGYSWNTSDLYVGGSISVVSADDMDSDGLDDAWEIKYFGNTDATPDGQNDGDIYSNWEEYIAGTDPTDTESFFGMFQPGILTTSGIVVKWDAVSNRTYTVTRYSGEIGGAVTTLVEHAEFPQNTYTDSVHKVWNFYNVEVQLK